MKVCAGCKVALHTILDELDHDQCITKPSSKRVTKLPKAVTKCVTKPTHEAVTKPDSIVTQERASRVAGRPRIYQNNADRQRAYRTRKRGAGNADND